jgi:hypothetical protein
MTIDLVNIGAAPDDGTGDPLRTAFSKTNGNFANLVVDVNTVQSNVANIINGTTAFTGNVTINNNNTATALYVYNAYTNTSNYERGKFAWSSNTFEIGTEAVGSGTRRPIRLNYSTTIDGFARTNVPALTVSNVGAGTGGLALGVLSIGYSQDNTRMTGFDVANKALSYSIRGSGVVASQGAHRFSGDAGTGTAVGANGSIVDILAPATATNIFQARQANETVVFNIAYDGSTSISGNLKLTGGINANSSVGTAGQVLTSSGASAYWSTLSNTDLVQSNLTTSVNTVSANVNSIASNVNTVQSNLTSLVNYVYACQTVTNATYSTSNVTNYVGVSYAGPVAIALHTGYTGQRITVKDETGYASTNAITLVGSIDNQSNAVLQINNGSLTLIYNNGWRII